MFLYTVNSSLENQMSVEKINLLFQMIPLFVNFPAMTARVFQFSQNISNSELLLDLKITARNDYSIPFRITCLQWLQFPWKPAGKRIASNSALRPIVRNRFCRASRDSDCLFLVQNAYGGNLTERETRINFFGIRMNQLILLRCRYFFQNFRSRPTLSRIAEYFRK